MRHVAAVVYLLFLTFSAVCQTSNEWLVPGQAYFKIPVGKEGLYKLTYSQLVNAGVPAALDPANFQLFHRGREVSIYVEGQGDGQFNTTDFIEFYGRRNDGRLDTELYVPAAAQPHQQQSLFTDTAYYFLTYGQSAGKRIPFVATPDPGAAAEIFHWDEKLKILSEQYSGGIDYNEVQKSVFEAGEGWTGNQILQGQTGTYVLEDIVNSVAVAGVPKLELLVTGRGPMDHRAEVYAGARLVGTVEFSAYASILFTADLQWSDIGGDGKVTIGLKVIGVGNVDRMSIGYLRLKYPRQLNIAGGTSKKFILQENAGGTSRVQIANTLVGTRVYDVTDVENVTRLAATGSSPLNVIVPSTINSRQLWATNTTLSTSVKKVSFRNYSPGTYDFVIVTHPDLRKPVAGYIDPVKAYAEYRSLPEGGGYDTLVVNINQLYDQFGYGDPSPLAVVHFLKYISTGKRPDYLFLVGKGLDVGYNYFRTPSTYLQYKNLVPSAGYPASDMLFSTGLSAQAHVAAISTGRLSATGPQDVAAYFNKVKEFESQPFDNLRKKNLLHLSGGLFEGEPEEFRRYLAEYADVAEDRFLGGKVKAIAKRSTDIEVVNVADEVNKGVALITLFGHSSPSSSDFDVGLVTDPVMGYNNKGKYTAFLMNGCSAGSFFLNSAIFGENWTNTPDRGAIAVIAHSYFGFAFTLRSYSRFFYETGFGDEVFIGKGIGDVQREVAVRYLANLSDGTPQPIHQTQILQMVLLGDPSVRLFGATKPDYAIVRESVSIQTKSGEPLNAFADSLLLSFVVPNYGKAVNQNIKIRVDRSLSDNSVLTYDSIIAGTLYSDTIRFLLPGNIDKGFGNNQFSIFIDSDEVADELNEANNAYQKTFFIPLSGTKNLYPNDFAIVHDTQVNLTFQHTNLLADEREFMVELDTTLEFNSGFKKQFSVTAKVLGMQPFTLPEDDSVVYFWRTKLAQPGPNENPEWQTSSFVYIFNGPEGWAQVRFSQFNDNLVTGLVKDATARRIEYVETEVDIAVKTFEATQPETFSVKVNGAEYNLVDQNNFPCRDNTINLIAFDRTTTQPYLGVFFSWVEIRDLFQGRQLYCGREPYIINSFRSDELTMGNGDLIHYIDNIADGDSVILFTNGDAGFPSWPAAAKTKLVELGIATAQIEALSAGEPVIIRARKGAASGSARFFRSSAEHPTTAEFSGTVTGRNSSGAMTSGLIGPASEWGQLIVRYFDKDAFDQITFDVFGVDLDGKESLLIEDLTTNYDLSGIDARENPFIKVRFESADETFVTSAQLDRWIVTFEPVAEGLLLYNGELDRVVKAEGQTLEKQYSFINISDRAFTEPLTVNFDLVNNVTQKTTSRSEKIMAPAPGDTTVFTLSVETIGHSGINTLEVNVNPRILPEVNYNNNIIGLTDHIRVLSDSVPPVLVVTFDGREIMRDEFVSKTPRIEVMIWDNNPFLLKKDTTGVLLFLKSPCAGNCAFERIYFSSPQVKWFAETDASEFRVEYNPFLNQPGSYTLQVVARDATGNISGTEPFEITFQVGDESIVQFASPYPNPFNVQANFEFVLTGSTLPEAASLQLVNLSGRVVNEFTLPVDNMHTGNNRVRWFAMDQNGNPAPNGVYIYRFKIIVEGQTFTQIGKVVLVR